MALTTFTTWTALYNSMLNDLASGNWKVASYSINGRTMQYRDFSQFKEALEYVKAQADAEGSSAPVSRTYAKQGGGGRW